MSSKKFFICIAFPMLLFALFGLTACGKPSLDDGDKDDEKVSISGGTNSVNEKIQEARAANGILISYTITSKRDGQEQISTSTFGANGDKYYFLIDDEEMIYDLSGSTGMDMYAKTTSDTLWTKSSISYAQMSKQDATALMNESYASFAAYMTSYSLYSAGGEVFVKSGTEEIAGHNCTKYKHTTSVLDASVSAIYWVEESTGICFKVGYEGMIYGEEETSDIVLTQYQETYTVSIPTEDQIDGDQNDNDIDCSHIDLDNDGICDLCDEPYDSQEQGTITLHAPDVEVDADNGLASWDAISNATGYICMVNGVERAKQTTTTIQLNDGDTLQVKAVGDGDKKKNSEWSIQASYAARPQYDFSNLGLTSYVESTLISYMEAEAGYYPDSDIYKCANGDLISYRGDSYIDIFSRNNGYTKMTLVYYYSTSDTTTDYELVNFMDNKYAYYADLAISASGLTVTNNRTTPVYANSQAFIDAGDYEILDYDDYQTDDTNAYELLSYTEYSGDVDADYLNTTYMHSSRYFSYLDDYSSKISNWKVERVNQEGKNYCDSKITIQFKENFSENDYLALLIFLRDEYDMEAYGGSNFEISDYGVNYFNGEIKVYDFPYEGDGEYIADKYKLMGGEGYPYSLIAEYTYLTYCDCGTYADYITTPNGLFRVLEGKEQLMIAPDGTVQEHILPPYKTLTNFEVTYTLDAEGDAEEEAMDYFVNTYTVKKVNDYILFTTTCEDSKEYIVYKIDDEMLYLRFGVSYDGSAVEWDDFEYYNDSYYNVLDVYIELIGKYFENQIKCTETGTATCVGESCSTYSYEDEDYIYKYYVNTEGITLRYIETGNDEDVRTREMKSYNDSVSSFTTQEQAIIDDSGISAYNGEE